jgi:glycopeptide antibiotics resistance protein
MPNNDGPTQIKLLSKIVLAAYMFILLWLVLFKFSFDIIYVLEEHQTRDLGLALFTGNLREMVANFVVFIPFGLLLSVNFKKITFWQKLAIVSFFSIAIEIIQFILAIGVTDITDVITNTLGGLIGMTLYIFGKTHVNSKKLDFFINVIGILIVILFLTLRFFVLRVKY